MPVVLLPVRTSDRNARSAWKVFTNTCGAGCVHMPRRVFSMMLLLKCISEGISQPVMKRIPGAVMSALKHERR